ARLSRPLRTARRSPQLAAGELSVPRTAATPRMPFFAAARRISPRGRRSSTYRSRDEDLLRLPRSVRALQRRRQGKQTTPRQEHHQNPRRPGGDSTQTREGSHQHHARKRHATSRAAPGQEKRRGFVPLATRSLDGSRTSRVAQTHERTSPPNASPEFSFDQAAADADERHDGI